MTPSEDRDEKDPGPEPDAEPSESSEPPAETSPFVDPPTEVSYRSQDYIRRQKRRREDSD